MAKEKKVGRPTTTSRSEILSAAISLIEEGGESALSFRKLGARLGLSAPSIYTYFPNKQALIEALSESVFQITPSEDLGSQSPKEKVTFWLSSLRSQLLEKQHLLFLFNTALPLSIMLYTIEQLAEIIEATGIERGKALRHGQSLLWMVLGFTVFESNSQQIDIVGEFEGIIKDYDDMLNHIDITNHDRLWEETLERNLLFLGP